MPLVRQEDYYVFRGACQRKKNCGTSEHLRNWAWLGKRRSSGAQAWVVCRPPAGRTCLHGPVLPIPSVVVHVAHKDREVYAHLESEAALQCAAFHTADFTLALRTQSLVLFVFPTWRLHPNMATSLQTGDKFHKHRMATSLLSVDKTRNPSFQSKHTEDDQIGRDDGQHQQTNDFHP